MNDFSADDATALDAIRDKQPQLWTNGNRGALGLPGDTWGGRAIGMDDIQQAVDRFTRFRPVLLSLFPELVVSGGVIESPLLLTPGLQAALKSPRSGQLYVKADHGLPVAGSIKARGGIHEVIEYAERLALEHGFITPDDAIGITTAAARKLFSEHQIAVGSTGNLGLSIGVIASALGFRATVHMSADAKEWKKQRLRTRNVTVVEHEGDYAMAVAAGRREALNDEKCHFVDDESSLSLFIGYSAAALALKAQLDAHGVVVDEQHPLFVYLACGVGGAPAGIAFGLAHVFGPNAHCFFAEPIASSCFLVSMLDKNGQYPSVYSFGLDNRTEADGLAVPRASEYAVDIMRPVVSGIFTVKDDDLFKHLYTAAQASLRIEPSAAAGFDGPNWLESSRQGQAYCARHHLSDYLEHACHVVWTTGGLYVPEEEYQAFVERGARLTMKVSA